jgi:type VI protein secretion system component VasK
MFFFIFSGEPFWILLMLAGSFICACCYFINSLWQRPDLKANYKWMWTILILGLPFVGLFIYAMNSKEIKSAETEIQV